jgi:uncharacterized protein involved in exopolysaccharide biosynthesis
MPQLSSILENMPIGGLLSKSFSLNDKKDYYNAILASMKLKLMMIDKFDLKTVYKFHKKKKYFIEDVVKELNEHIEIGDAEDGILTILIEDRSPQRAAAMANFMIYAIDSINKDITRSKYRYLKEFLFNRLDSVNVQLKEKEKKFAYFQVTNKIYEVDQQAKSSIENIANMEARLFETTLEIEMIRNTVGENSNQYKAGMLKRREILKLKTDIENGTNSSVFLNISKMPNLALQYYENYREYKIVEYIYKYLMEQYEGAKYQEAKNVPTITALDQAIIPQKKASPKRGKICIMITTLVFFISILLAIFLDYFSYFKNNHTAEFNKAQSIFARIKKWD